MNKSHVWFRFSKSINNTKIKFRWEILPRERFEEFIDFKMKYYVKHEFTHKMAGISKSPKAMVEYRNILTQLYERPSYYTNICCVDDETNKIIGFDSMKLFKKSETYCDFWPAKTAEVKLLYKITTCMDKLCPVPDVVKKYEVNQFFDDVGLAIHPGYRGHKFAAEVVLLRNMMCTEHNVPLTGAWMTSTFIQNITKHEGWHAICEVTSGQLEKILGIKFSTTSQTFVYKVKRFY